MKQQTAISWLRKKLEETYNKEGKLPLAYTFSLLNKAEAMEKEQIVNAFDCDGSPQQGEKWISNGEQYYKETFNAGTGETEQQ